MPSRPRASCPRAAHGLEYACRYYCFHESHFFEWHSGLAKPEACRHASIKTLAIAALHFLSLMMTALHMQHLLSMMMMTRSTMTRFPMLSSRQRCALARRTRDMPLRPTRLRRRSRRADSASPALLSRSPQGRYYFLSAFGRSRIHRRHFDKDFKHFAGAVNHFHCLDARCHDDGAALYSQQKLQPAAGFTDFMIFASFLHARALLDDAAMLDRRMRPLRRHAYDDSRRSLNLRAHAMSMPLYFLAMTNRSRCKQEKDISYAIAMTGFSSIQFDIAMNIGMISSPEGARCPCASIFTMTREGAAGNDACVSFG